MDYKIERNEDSVTVSLQMAGYDKENISITADGRDLTVTAKDGMFYPGFCRKNFVTANTIDISQAVARYDDGVLSITIPKHDTSKKISIS